MRPGQEGRVCSRSQNPSAAALPWPPPRDPGASSLTEVCAGRPGSQGQERGRRGAGGCSGPRLIRHLEREQGDWTRRPVGTQLLVAGQDDSL